MNCPLCESSNIADYFNDKVRSYLRCECCDLVFVPEEFHLSDVLEKSEYDMHENSINDPGYKKFLSPVVDAVISRVSENSLGLDFGCGPGPALASMLHEKQYDVNLYDKFYRPDKSVFTQKYEFVTATEVLEHLKYPGKELEFLWNIIREGGWLFVMTQRVISRDRFERWGYKNDPTHICFFSDETINFLGEKLGALKVEYEGNSIVCFQKLK